MVNLGYKLQKELIILTMWLTGLKPNFKKIINYLNDG